MSSYLSKRSREGLCSRPRRSDHPPQVGQAERPQAPFSHARHPRPKRALACAACGRAISFVAGDWARYAYNRPMASTTNRRSSAIAPAGPIPGRELFIRALDLVSSTDQRRPLTNQPLGVLAQSGRYVPSRQLQEAGIAAVGPGLDPLGAEAQLRRKDLEDRAGSELTSVRPTEAGKPGRLSFEGELAGSRTERHPGVGGARRIP